MEIKKYTYSAHAPEEMENAVERKVQFLMIRHSFRDVENREDFLSVKGRKDARTFKLPVSMLPLHYIGGSEMLRTYETAVAIATGNNQNPRVLASMSAFGSMRQLDEMGASLEKWEALYNELGTNLRAIKSLLTPFQLTLLQTQMTATMIDLASLTERQGAQNFLIVTHSPWLELLLEKITNGHLADLAARELEWAILEVVFGRSIKLVETQIHCA